MKRIQVTVVLDIEYTYKPGRRGRYDGPPEMCYPAEPPEIDIRVMNQAEIDEIVMAEIEIQEESE